MNKKKGAKGKLFIGNLEGKQKQNPQKLLSQENCSFGWKGSLKTLPYSPVQRHSDPYTGTCRHFSGDRLAPCFIFSFYYLCHKTSEHLMYSRSRNILGVGIQWLKHDDFSPLYGQQRSHLMRYCWVCQRACLESFCEASVFPSYWS